MAKQLSYVQIVRNLVDSAMNTYVFNHTGGQWFPRYENSQIRLEKMDSHCVWWSVPVTVQFRSYEVHGIVGEWGTVTVSSVAYERMRCTRKDENGEWITESAKPFHGFVYGDALERFTFSD